MLINKSFCLADEAKVSVVTYTAKIPKISLRAYIFQRPLFRRAYYSENSLSCVAVKTFSIKTKKMVYGSTYDTQ